LDPRSASLVTTARGNTVILDDGTKHKRNNLLKVADTATSSEPNVIEQAKKERKKALQEKQQQQQ
jgi:hypothetical protein